MNSPRASGRTQWTRAAMLQNRRRSPLRDVLGCAIAVATIRYANAAAVLAELGEYYAGARRRARGIHDSAGLASRPPEVEEGSPGASAGCGRDLYGIAFR